MYVLPCIQVMYPMASIVNHSCFPNTACVADGHRLVFEALRPILIGQELLQCYVRLGEAERDAMRGTDLLEASSEAAGDDDGVRGVPSGSGLQQSRAPPSALLVKPEPTAEWGFSCTCERCDGTASAEVLKRFDLLHLCPCGSITTRAMKAAAQAVVGGPACRCHTHNHVQPNDVPC